MSKWVSAREARTNFGDVLDFIADSERSVTIEEGGKHVAVVLSPSAFERLTEHLW